MRAEVIAIGDELTTGERLDTNSQWLSQCLTEMGVQVAFHTTIGDELADNVVAFRTALERADVVVITGGLGPTADDLTREAIATATDTELVRNEAALEHISNLFASRGREMPVRNEVQADFPAGSLPIANPHGTAPGIEMTITSSEGKPCTLFALPGVPAEMTPMWQDSVAPRIAELQPEPRVIRHRSIKCFGVGESQLEAMLPDLIRRDREPRVGITVSQATITLRITATDADEGACFASMEPTVATIYSALGKIIFGEEEDELQDAVLRLLADRQLTLSVADWATEGLVDQWLAAADQESLIYRASAEPDAPLRGVPHSADAAIEIAQRVRQQSQTDFGLGLAAFPPPDEQHAEYVYVALATPTTTRKFRLPTASHPAIVQSRTAKQALNALRLALL